MSALSEMKGELPLRWQSRSWLLVNVVVALAYFVAAYVGDKSGLVLFGNLTLFWPPSGIALVALLYFGRRAWAGVWLGSFLGNIVVFHVPGSPAASMAINAAIGAGSALQAVVAAQLVRRVCANRNPLHRPSDVIRFIGITLVTSSISAAIATPTLSAAHLVSPENFVPFAWTWALGDATGMLVVAPFLLAWIEGPPRESGSGFEAASLLLVTALVGHAVFGTFGGEPHHHALEHLFLPLLVWAALRFGSRGVTALIFIVYMMAMIATPRGRGPFAVPSPGMSVLLLQAFLGDLTIAALTLSAMLTQRRRAEDSLRDARDELEQRVAARTRELSEVNAQLLRSEKRFRAMVEGSGDAVALVDAKGEIAYESPNAPRITGYAIADRLGRSAFEAVHPDDREKVRAALGRAAAEPEGMVRSVEFRSVRSDGSEWWAEGSFVNMLQEPSVRAIVLNYRDVSDRKRAGEEKSRLEEQLQHARKMEAIGTLAGGVAHDFNNILGGVLSGLSILELSGASERQRAEIREMKAAVQRGADLTKQLLGFGRRGKYDVRPLDLAVILEKTSSMYGRTRRDVTIELDLPPGVRAVLMDHAQLEQVLLNLLLNAGQAMPGGGRIALRANNAELTAAQAALRGMTPGSYVELVVADTGAGMDAATLARVFEPFFTTKPVGQGSGLGLASVYGIVKNHGGTVSVESELGKGTTFKILLPAADIPSAADSAPSPPPPSDRHGNVLVVDDDDQFREPCARLLRAMGYTVLTASGGRAALVVAREHAGELALVILDLVMPDMSGAKTYDALREIAPDVKVLLASGFTADAQAQELLARGASGFIQKPFDGAALAAKIESLG